MLKASERAFDPCRPGDLRPDLPCSGLELLRKPLPCTVFWLTASILLLIVAFHMDAWVGRLLLLTSSDRLKEVAHYASEAGEGWVVAVVGLAGSVFYFLRGRFNASREVFLVAFTGLLTGAAATLIRCLLGRTRPSSHELQGFYGIWHDSHWIFGKYEFASFPSGHVATVIGLAAAAWMFDRRLGLLAGIYAILVSWSRIALGCHHFSDAVAAAILGIYGAHLLLPHLGPQVYRLGERLQLAWRNRR